MNSLKIHSSLKFRIHRGTICHLYGTIKRITLAHRWYSVSVASNYEKRIAETIRANAEKSGLSKEISQVVVPVENVVEVRKGRRVEKEHRFMPGYVLIQMEMSNKAYHLVKSINRVSGFLGSRENPSPLNDSEVEDILKRASVGQIQPRSLISFDVGDKVMVTDGPFEGWNGMVEEVDDLNSRVIIGVSIFGRVTQTELSFDQVTKDK